MLLLHSLAATTPLPVRAFMALALVSAVTIACPLAKGALHITEFMADNGGSLLDSDGDSSDWIEIFNSGPGTVSLDGYNLTDDESLLAKWSFPAVQLPAGGFLLVFASEKDRRVVGDELHTNFRLASGGEYLALVEPDGATIVAEFGPAADPLPAQFEDVSYGLMQSGNRTPAVLIDGGASGRVLVPSDATLGNTWTGPAFDDNSWDPVSMGIGYDENTTYIPEFGAGGNLGSAMNDVNTTVYLRVPFNLTEAASVAELTLKMKYDDGFAAFLNGTQVAFSNSPGLLAWNSEATGNHADGEATTLEDFDITSFAGLLTEGINVLAIQGMNDQLSSSDMLISLELHALRVTDPSLGGPGFLAVPTPGTINGDTFDGFVADTAFSVDRGFYESSFDVEISTATPGAEIRYTLDGTAPTPTRGTVYSGPVAINGTTILRAMAHMPGLAPTNVDTHTYVFPADVVNQADMRTAITQSPSYGPQMIDSLKAVPTISLVTENTGFLNEGASNIRTEHQTSIEMIFPDGTPGFQENGGLSNYGGRFTNFRKKSFRVAFREQFGATKLKYPIFDGFDYSHFPPADEFDVINLRSGSHDMSSRGAYMSNRFTDDSMLDMGNIAPHGRFVHVYLNGRYWGQYHLRERWSADMAASYFGGPKEDYDAVNANDNFQNDLEVYDGTGQFWSEMNSLMAGPDPFVNASGHIDVASIMDFMLLWVSGNSESEFRSFGSGPQGVPFKFMIKDADGFLRSPGHAVDHAGPLSAMSRFHAGDPDYAMFLADRIHKHFFNDGALTPAQNIARLQRRVDEARPGFVSEAARWGDIFREPPSWESYQANLINNHFPGLTRTMIGRFESAGMYPEIGAPVFSQYGGSVSPDTPVTMATDADTIYYTLDGMDPRLPGGAPDPNALIASFGGGGPSPVTYISTGHRWKYLDDGSDQGAAWSGEGFDDSAWAEGPSPLGYGGDGEATTVSFGPDSGNKYPTTYFRTTVDIPDPSIFLNFLVRLRYDDAAAVYLNGNEIIRTSNLPAGATFDQYASADNGSEGAWFDFTFPTADFRAGVNSIAVEVHQGDGGSSDIRLDLIVRGETTQGGGNNVTDPIFFAEPATLRARSYNSGSGEWSALNEAFFSIDTVPADAASLVVSEFHYHPTNPTSPGELAVSSDRDDYEFLEFLNIGANALDMTGVHFDAGIDFAFPVNTLLPTGERLLLVRNRPAFEARYGVPVGVQVFEYTGRLSNDGEQVIISGAGPDPIQDFTYNDQEPWPTAADGEGSSLVLLEPATAPPHNAPLSWRASRRSGGSPGMPEPDGITYAAWAVLNGVVGGPDDDDDGDEFSNWFEFLFGTRPDLASDAPTPVGEIQSIDVGGVVSDYFTLTFPKNIDAEGAGLTIEMSSDLSSWMSDPALTEEVSVIDNGDGTATVTIRLADPVDTGEGRLYLRLRGM